MEIKLEMWLINIKKILCLFLFMIIIIILFIPSGDTDSIRNDYNEEIKKNIIKEFYSRKSFRLLIF